MQMPTIQVQLRAMLKAEETEVKKKNRTFTQFRSNTPKRGVWTEHGPIVTDPLESWGGRVVVWRLKSQAKAEKKRDPRETRAARGSATFRSWGSLACCGV